MVLSEGTVRRGEQLPTVKAEYDLIGSCFCHPKDQFSQFCLEILHISCQFKLSLYIKIIYVNNSVCIISI